MVQKVCIKVQRNIKNDQGHNLPASSRRTSSPRTIKMEGVGGGKKVHILGQYLNISAERSKCKQEQSSLPPGCCLNEHSG
jgi:hypothetical protein